jgi:hypothetical protein
MARIGFFKRVGPPIGNIKTGDIIKADYDAIMEHREGGWMYLKQPSQALMNQQRVVAPKPMPQPIQRPSYEPKVIQMDSPSWNEGKSEDDQIKEVVNFYESIEKSRQEEIDRAIPPTPSIEVNIDKLKELKKLTNKEWFSVTKDQSIKLLTEANIDFSHVPKTKWDLVKFIKGIIKDL